MGRNANLITSPSTGNILCDLGGMFNGSLNVIVGVDIVSREMGLL